MNFRILLLSESRQLKKIFTELASRLPAQLFNPPNYAGAEFSIASEKVDAIFADASFPGLSRHSLMQDVKGSPVNSRAVIYLITGLASPSDQRPQEQGFVIIQKPSSASEIEPLLARLKSRLATERRRTGRLRFRATVQGKQGPHHFQATSTNLSAQGMMIETTTVLERGAEFDFGFPLEPDAPVINGRARIMRIQGPGRYGMNFVSLDQPARQRLQRYLDIHLSARRAELPRP